MMNITLLNIRELILVKKHNKCKECEKLFKFNSILRLHREFILVRNFMNVNDMGNLLSVCAI